MTDLFFSTIFNYSNLGLNPILTERLLPIETEAGEILQKENLND
jgi:hypothetical protein